MSEFDMHPRDYEPTPELALADYQLEQLRSIFYSDEFLKYMIDRARLEYEYSIKPFCAVNYSNNLCRQAGLPNELEVNNLHLMFKAEAAKNRRRRWELKFSFNGQGTTYLGAIKDNSFLFSSKALDGMDMSLSADAYEGISFIALLTNAAAYDLGLARVDEEEDGEETEFDCSDNDTVGEEVDFLSVPHLVDCLACFKEWANMYEQKQITPLKIWPQGDCTLIATTESGSCEVNGWSACVYNAKKLAMNSYHIEETNVLEYAQSIKNPILLVATQELRLPQAELQKMGMLMSDSFKILEPDIPNQRLPWQASILRARKNTEAIVNEYLN